jgi:hypothetical protein
MSLKDYSLLPDFMPSSAIDSYIKEILTTVSLDKNISFLEAANALLEMIVRQNENYDELLDEQTIIQIKEWVVNTWSPSIELTDILSTIIVNLNSLSHFAEGYSLLESASHSDNAKIKAIAREALAEMPRDSTNNASA